MAIRIRTVDGVRVAICAARSVPKWGDVYLNDGDHHALSVKFDLDFVSMYFLKEKSCYADSEEARVMEQEESNNPNRVWWDSEYGTDNSNVEQIDFDLSPEESFPDTQAAAIGYDLAQYQQRSGLPITEEDIGHD